MSEEYGLKFVVNGEDYDKIKKALNEQIEDLEQKVEQLEKELNQEKEEYAGLHKVLNNKEEEFEKENYNNVVEISRLKREVEKLEKDNKNLYKIICKNCVDLETTDEEYESLKRVQELKENNKDV